MWDQEFRTDSVNARNTYILINDMRQKCIHYKQLICNVFIHLFHEIHKKKSRIRETKPLSTDADSSTDTTVGWTKNTPKPKFIKKRKKSSKTEKLKNVWKYAKNLRYAL